MKIIYNSLIPIKGFTAITLWPFIFVRKEFKNTNLSYTVNHENIHGAQQKELLLIGFYIIYLYEWIRNLIIYKDSNKAYTLISFEREAYSNMYNLNYLKERKHFAQWK